MKFLDIASGPNAFIREIQRTYWQKDTQIRVFEALLNQTSYTSRLLIRSASFD